MSARKTVIAPDESEAISADRTGVGEFFIDDYSHLRLSYYQCQDENVSFDLSDSAYSSNATSNETFNVRKDENVLSEEERRKLREYYVSQIPDLPHPANTVASIIASASRRMGSGSNFVYNKTIEQGNVQKQDINTPKLRSTLKPDKK